MSPGRSAFLGVALGLACLCARPSAAAELKVYPVRLALSAKAPIATLTIHNAGQAPARLQMKVYAWSQKDGEDVLEPTRAILANPGAFELPPGGEQIARFGLQDVDPSREQSYRVLIQEVPDAAAGKPGEVVALLRISIPIFTPPTRVDERVAWTVRPTADGKAEIEVANQGDEHIQLTSLKLARAQDGQVLAQQKLSAYVLPGSARRLLVDCAPPIRPGEALTLSAATDRTGLQASVVSEAGRDERAR